MAIRSVLCCLPFLWCLLPRTSFADDQPRESQPNIIIFFTDDQGFQDVGAFGSPDIRTPHLDQMAADGVRFTNFHVAQAVCSASRAALLTGVPGKNLRQPGNWMKESSRLQDINRKHDESED